MFATLGRFAAGWVSTLGREKSVEQRRKEIHAKGILALIPHSHAEI